jgi:hypothetical protein
MRDETHRLDTDDSTVLGLSGVLVGLSVSSVIRSLGLRGKETEEGGRKEDERTRDEISKMYDKLVGSGQSLPLP